MLHWASQRNILLFLDSNEYTHTTGIYECVCASGAEWTINNDDSLLTQLKSHHEEHKDWLFGHINYDFKNKLEDLSSKHPAHLHFPELQFFRPETVCYIPRNTNRIFIETINSDPEWVWNEICAQGIPESEIPATEIHFKKRIAREKYLQIIEQLRAHIAAGDCYEINFCNEAYSEHVPVNPLAAFERLNAISKAPFAAYYKLEDKYLMCASPERYLFKKGAKIIAQPIKGTARRSEHPDVDKEQKILLAGSIKEQAENVMIADLMRNDLARCCIPGTVEAEELFGIYSFPQVHQMISTISGTIKKDCSLFDVLRLSFPMGSMTGAPKIMVMKLIEQYEMARRELFSGCVGYISPEGNFDFNVVIRSLFYNATNQYLSYQTGGAITYDSDPVSEWEETLLKAKAMEKVF